MLTEKQMKIYQKLEQGPAHMSELVRCVWGDHINPNHRSNDPIYKLIRSMKLKGLEISCHKQIFTLEKGFKK